MIPLAAIGCGSAGCGSRHATIVLGQKLTEGPAVTLFIKLIGKLFSQANNRKATPRELPNGDIQGILHHGFELGFHAQEPMLVDPAVEGLERIFLTCRWPPEA